MELYELTSAHPGLTYCLDTIPVARDLLVNTYRAGGKLLLCGNGGSAADCDHIAGELLKGFLSLRPLSEEDCMTLADTLPEGEADPDLYLLAGHLQGGLPAISLPAQTAAVTAVYSWKAKAENKIKLTNIMVKELADKYGIEAVVSLLGISLSD